MSTLLIAVGVCHLLMAGLLLFNRLRTPALESADSLPPPARWPSVLAVIPARNEETNIEACVRALLQQDYPALRVRVVDDNSTDRTPAIVASICAADPRLELVRAPKLPPGWMGKPHALHTGVQGEAAATADYLLFVDADLRVAPQTLRRTVALAERRQAGLTTVVPALTAETFWERAVQPVVALLLFFLLDPVKVRDPASGAAAAYGPFLLFRRSAYQQIGGHTAVRSEVIEDLRLAQLIKQAGLPLEYLHGPSGVWLRMYESLRGLVNGWRKNFHVTFGRAYWLAPIAAAAIALVLALPTVAAVTLVVQKLLGADIPVRLGAAALFCYGADWLARLSLMHNFGLPLRGVRSLGGLVVAYIFISSAYRAATGKAVSWRGRSFSTDGVLVGAASAPAPASDPAAETKG